MHACARVSGREGGGGREAPSPHGGSLSDTCDPRDIFITMRLTYILKTSRISMLHNYGDVCYGRIRREKKIPQSTIVALTVTFTTVLESRALHLTLASRDQCGQL